MHDRCYHTNSEPLDCLILLNLCQHYFEVTATSSLVGWGDSNDWLQEQQSWLLRLHFVFMSYGHKQGKQLSKFCVWVHIKGLLFIHIILQAASPSCAHANGVRYDIFTVLLHLQPVRKACSPASTIWCVEIVLKIKAQLLHMFSHTLVSINLLTGNLKLSSG